MLVDLKQISLFVAAFETRKLPRELWTHRSKCVVGLWYVLTNDFDTAVQRMRDGIRSYNEACGIANSETSGYHETITVFYMKALRVFASYNRRVSERTELFRRLLKDDLIHASFVKRFYSIERLRTATARSVFLEPDLRELPPRQISQPITQMIGLSMD